jgi:hypothetical protein
VLLPVPKLVLLELVAALLPAPLLDDPVSDVLAVPLVAVVEGDEDRLDVDEDRLDVDDALLAPPLDGAICCRMICTYVEPAPPVVLLKLLVVLDEELVVAPVALVPLYTSMKATVSPAPIVATKLPASGIPLLDPDPDVLLVAPLDDEDCVEPLDELVLEPEPAPVLALEPVLEPVVAPPLDAALPGMVNDPDQFMPVNVDW